MSYEVKGTITAIGQTQNVTDKFKKRSFDITETGTSYNGDDWKNMISMEFTNDKCALLDNVNVGDEAIAKFVVSTNRGTSQAGKEYCITNIRAVSIDVLNKAQTHYTQPTPQQQPTPSAPQAEPQYIAPLTDNDIPF